MKKLFTLLYIIAALSAKGDYWTQKANYPGACTYNYSFSFAIGNKGYTGCGLDSVLNPRKDFWEWDQSTNLWTQKADFAGNARTYAVSFSILDKGYAGLGQDTSGIQNTLIDFWEYAFVIGNKGFICCGGSNLFYNILWQYDPATDVWTQKTNFPGQERIAAISFSIGNKAYLGSGHDTWSSPLQDFWEYDFFSDSWSQKANVPGVARTDASEFSIGNYGYYGTGVSGSVCLNDFWQYNPTSDLWTQKATFPGLARRGANSFSIGNRGYYCKGNPYSSIIYFQDLWEYGPDSTTGIEELSTSNLQFTILSNSVKEFLVISYPLIVKEKIDLTITDVNGKIIYATQLQVKTSNFKLQISNFSKGIYFVEISDGEQRAMKKFLKE